MSLRKGQLYRRSDGYVFRVESASRKAPGAFMQCVDATQVFGWFDAEKIKRDFVRAPEGSVTEHVVR